MFKRGAVVRFTDDELDAVIGELFNLWPECVCVRGRPRHSQSNGGVRAPEPDDREVLGRLDGGQQLKLMGLCRVQDSPLANQQSASPRHPRRSVSCAHWPAASRRHVQLAAGDKRVAESGDGG